MGLRRETILASALRTTNGDSGIINIGQDLYVAGGFELDVTAIDTGTTLDVYIQRQLPEGGANWDDFIHFTQVTTATGKFVAWVVASGNVAGAQDDAALAAATVKNGPIGGNWRVKWVLVGTSYTFSVSADLFS